jgi:hypothetical protein
MKIGDSPAREHIWTLPSAARIRSPCFDPTAVLGRPATKELLVLQTPYFRIHRSRPRKTGIQNPRTVRIAEKISPLGQIAHIRPSPRRGSAGAIAVNKTLTRVRGFLPPTSGLPSLPAYRPWRWHSQAAGSRGREARNGRSPRPPPILRLDLCWFRPTSELPLQSVAKLLTVRRELRVGGVTFE